MGTVSRGYKGRRRPSVELPSGQYLVEDVPALSAGPTPSIDLVAWASGDSVQSSGRADLPARASQPPSSRSWPRGGEGAHV
jgi:hypothetical protein